MELHRRALGAVSPFALAALFVVGFAAASDVPAEADVVSELSETQQVLVATGFSHGLGGWRGKRARVGLVSGDSGRDMAAGVTARQRRGRFTLTLRPGPPQETNAGDEYSVSAKLKALKRPRKICVELSEGGADGTVGQLTRCRVVRRQWTTISATRYIALAEGNRIFLDVYSVARRGLSTQANRFLVTSVKLTRKCKGEGAAARCGSTTTTTTDPSTTTPATTSGETTTSSDTTVSSTEGASTVDTMSTSTTDPLPPPVDPLVPASGILFGAKPGYSQTEAASFESLIGRKLALREIVFDWSTIWPDSRTLDDHTKGRTNMISWKGTSLADVLSGSQDALIRDRAGRVASLGFPILIRWAHEMNGDWYLWGRQPTAYVSAWRRIHTIFEQEGANNVRWVWSPSIPQGNWDAYYPGDAYVDWIGGDNYNWGTCSESSGGWRLFTAMFKEYHDHFAGRGKPMMLAEVGSAEQGGSKGAWLGDAQAAIKGMPAYRAWVHQQYSNGVCNWKIDSSSSSLDAYRTLAADPYFNGS
jgi:hypothetical protein